MIPNVVKGGNTYGLIRYLQGEGRYNEHENPHVVGGDDFLVAWYGTETLAPESVREISGYLDEPRDRFGTTMKTRVTEQDPETGERRVVGHRDAHVWHCSLSLRAEEGPLSNEQWREISEEFMDRMGFTQASGKAPCRWVAIHHGRSKSGNDHIHIAATMVREDGTRWDGRWRDYAKAQEACRELEAKHGLEAVRGSELGIGERGESPAQRRRAERVGSSRTAPKELAERLRAAAVASTSEAEWIRRVRADGVVVKPFFAKGTTDVVAGYRAALKPETRGERLAFYGGGTVGRDLSLPRLRESWPAASVETAGEASAEWQAAFRGQPPVGAGVETKQMGVRAPEVAAANFEAFNAQLAQVPPGDRVAWAEAARDVSGALSAWARYDAQRAPQLREAAAALSRAAQYRRPGLAPGRRIKESPMGTAFVFLAAKPEDQGKIAAALLMRQMINTAKALAGHHRAIGDLRHAQRLERDAVARLQRIDLSGYHPGEGGVVATMERPTTTPTQDHAQAGDPLPRPLPEPRPRTQVDQSRNSSTRRSGHER